MLLLPNNMKCIAGHSDESGGHRWATQGIYVEALPDNRYAVAATDTRTLVLVEGVCPGDPGEYPEFGALVDAPNGGMKGLIPSGVWADIMAESSKATKKVSRPLLRSVAFQMADAKVEPERVDEETGEPIKNICTPAQVVMGWTNLEKSNTPTCLQIEGKFPPYRNILPKKRGKVQISIDPDYFIRVADTLKNMRPLGDKSQLRVEMDFTSNQKPIMFRFENVETNQKVQCMVMPLATDDNTMMWDGYSAGDGISTPEFWEAEAQRWKEEHEKAMVLSDKRFDLITDLQKQLRELKALPADRLVVARDVDAIESNHELSRERNELLEKIADYEKQTVISNERFEELIAAESRAEALSEAARGYEPANVVEAIDGEDLRGVIRELREKNDRLLQRTIELENAHATACSGTIDDRGELGTLRRQLDQYAGLEQELVQVRLQLQAREEDVALYRARLMGG